ncbi:non-hydrolyzing UDP-N-acetylglucosamine 2-epimerase [Salinibacter ruber]|uniref:non-hydrolyzing UDP-N-acetylglucosamine 2-epimerase n=1 Tax=Salinibacter ruber TaxID=146919 RepID=UPI0021683A53|nr:UDP-N-acetylglucosamine 2-epimerase (non-hydrolyzing) [Salinibacter ruber]MCS3683881.1 UDP-N-acetylglucosamine 2-epimerase (non-hydrolyzing) [Salinibacter ruber]
MRIAVLIGTRPGIIKMAPLVHKADELGAESVVIHSGQHYSSNMDNQIMQDVGLHGADYHIERPEDCVTHAEQTAYMLTNIEEALLDSNPDVLLVCGDANTNLAGALAARKLHVKVGHVEAGLRSFDWRMPEEHNRVMIDHISEYLFAPTEISRDHLEEDGVQGDVFVVGNTIVDSTLAYAEKISDDVTSQIDNLTGGSPYLLLTSHREENVDDPEVLERVLAAVEQIGRDHDLTVIFPAHPRTSKRIEEFGLQDKVERFEHILDVEPFRYREFLGFLKNAEFVITDSGGIQEESCVLQVPCITIRESTERPETVEVGANQVAGTDPADIRTAVDKLSDRATTWPNPYGDGKTSQRIIDTCLHGEPRDEFTAPQV